MAAASDVAVDLSAAALVTGAVVVRTGALLLAVGAGRARSAGSAAWRSILECCLVTLAILSIVSGVLPLLPMEIPAIPPGAELAGALLGAVAIAGCIGERSTTRVGIAAAIVYAAVLVPFGLLAAPYLTQYGFVDRAGMSIFVLPAGVLALFAASLTGPRSGRFARDGSISVIPPHQMPLMLAGLMVLILGWMLIAVTLSGSWSVPPSGGAALLLGVAAGILAGSAYTRWRFGHIDSGLIVPAAVGAVAAVSAGLGVFSMPVVVAVGAVGGVAAVYLHLLLERRIRIDDVTGVSAAMVVGTVAGVLAAGVVDSLSSAGTNLPVALPALADQIFVQAFGLSLFVLATLVASAVVLIPLSYATRFRVSDEVDYDGLDLAQLDLNAYPDFQQPMIRSSHMREV